MFADASGETGLSHKESFGTAEAVSICTSRWASITKVLFFLCHTRVHAAKASISVNNALAGHQNQKTLWPSMEILACQRVINSQIKPTSMRAGITQEAGKELWTQHHSPSLMGEGMLCRILTSETGIQDSFLTYIWIVLLIHLCRLSLKKINWLCIFLPHSRPVRSAMTYIWDVTLMKILSATP